MGVTVSDDTRSWRADGLSFVYAYDHLGGPAGRTGKEIEHVAKLVHDRTQSRARALCPRD